MQALEGLFPMLTLDYKLDGTPAQYAAIDEGIRTVQFIRNTCLRVWMDRLPEGKTFEAMSGYTAVLAKEFAFAGRLGSQARQASAGRAWAAVSRFYDNCKKQIRARKAIPSFSMIAGAWNTKRPRDGILPRMASISPLVTGSASEQYG